MVVTEGMAVLSGIILQSTLGLIDVVIEVGRAVDGIVGLFEGALAVPSVARMVLGPEGIVDREGELCLPVNLV